MQITTDELDELRLRLTIAGRSEDVPLKLRKRCTRAAAIIGDLSVDIATDADTLLDSGVRGVITLSDWDAANAIRRSTS